MAVRGVIRNGWKRRIHGSTSSIPAPSGSFSVGCVDLMHKFEDETDSLLVRLFYPCDGNSEGRYQYAFWNPHERYIKGIMDFMQATSPRLESSLSRRFADLRMPAFNEAPILKTPELTLMRSADGSLSNQMPPSTASAKLVFPLIVYSHGLGGMRTDSCSVCCDLASHGYIVGAVEHRDRSACVSMKRVPKPGGQEGELQDDWLKHYHLQERVTEFPIRLKQVKPYSYIQVKQRAVDAKRTLDLLGVLNDGGEVGNMLGVNFDFHQFQGRMDIDTAAIMGHSFGGATTVQTLSEDKRFKCGIGQDTWMGPIHEDLYKNGSIIEQPLLFINSSNDFQWKENIQKMLRLTKPPDSLGRSMSRIITLKNTTHMHQTDMIFVYPNLNEATPESDPVVAHEINMDVCHAFLRRHLLKDPAYQQPIPNLDGCEGHSEHILFGTNMDISEDKDTEGGGVGQGESVPPPEVGVDNQTSKHSKL